MNEENRAEKAPENKVTTWVKRIALVVVLLVALVAGGRWLAWRMAHVVTDAGFVKADITEVAPEVPAKVLKIHVKEGDRVQAGQLLMELDDKEFSDKEAIAEAEVRLLTAQIGVQQAKLAFSQGDVPAAIRAAEAAVAAAKEVETQARAQEAFLAKQERRFAALAEQKAVGRARFEEIEAQSKAAHAAAEAAAAQVKAAEGKLAEARANRAKIDEAAAGVSQVQEGLSKAGQTLNLSRTMRGKCRVVAPVAGIVARKFYQEGDFAVPGRPAVALYDPASLYVEARFEETKLRHLKVGQKVGLELDSLPGQKIIGTVRLIHRASAGEFALIPRDVTAGEFTKLTQRVPVEIDFNGDVARESLVPGLSVNVAARRNGQDER